MANDSWGERARRIEQRLQELAGITDESGMLTRTRTAGENMLFQDSNLSRKLLHYCHARTHFLPIRTSVYSGP
jgi:hypothetical protein